MSGFRSVVSLGVDFDRVDTAQKLPLGTRESDEAGREFVYVSANGAIGAGVPVKMDGSYDVAAAGNGGTVWGIAHVALADNEFGWVQVRGSVTGAQVAASTADNAIVSRLADANGDLQAVAAVDEGSTTSHSAGAHSIFGQLLSAESGGTAEVFIF